MAQAPVDKKKEGENEEGKIDRNDSIISDTVEDKKATTKEDEEDEV